MKTLLASAVLMLAPLAAHAACAPTDFAIQDFKVVQGARMSMKGQVMNHCAEAAAAQISIAAKDANGRVIQEKKGWPAGTTNIAPGQTVEFDLGRLFRYSSDMATYTVSIASVRSW
ncbi:hypothetical protein [Dyella sp.]|jgi:hypothetical protein|uniref:hypothetical protein n=1 Tax=Dyella sp. TaxID=1869338 RepID=UPI002D767432|nr:hypothetical protein [Dyella sp.]HET6431084.1 hypothetical protein [Dyella sp.]